MEPLVVEHIDHPANCSRRQCCNRHRQQGSTHLFRDSLNSLYATSRNRRLYEVGRRRMVEAVRDVGVTIKWDHVLSSSRVTVPFLRQTHFHCHPPCSKLIRNCVGRIAPLARRGAIQWFDTVAVGEESLRFVRSTLEISLSIPSVATPGCRSLEYHQNLPRPLPSSLVNWRRWFNSDRTAMQNQPYGKRCSHRVHKLSMADGLMRDVILVNMALPGWRVGMRVGHVLYS